MAEENFRELAIRIVNEFEELLADKGIMVPSKDREGGEAEACLYGSEYYALADGVVGVLMEAGEGKTERSRRWLSSSPLSPGAIR